MRKKSGKRSAWGEALRREKDSANNLEKARNYAFLLLKFRLRSEKELIQRLKAKKFDPAVIKETISFLKERDFIGDEAFASSWIRSRLKKPLGLERIRQELRLKGVGKDIIEDKINEIKNSYHEEDAIEAVAHKRAGQLSGLEPKKLKQRLFAYLLRRGFSSEAVIGVLNKL